MFIGSVVSYWTKEQIMFWKKDRQSDEVELSQVARQETSGGFKGFQHNRSSDNRRLTPTEVRRIREANNRRRNR